MKFEQTGRSFKLVEFTVDNLSNERNKDIKYI